MWRAVVRACSMVATNELPAVPDETFEWTVDAAAQIICAEIDASPRRRARSKNTAASVAPVLKSPERARRALDAWLAKYGHAPKKGTSR